MTYLSWILLALGLALLLFRQRVLNLYSLALGPCANCGARERFRYERVHWRCPKCGSRRAIPKVRPPGHG